MAGLQFGAIALAVAALACAAGGPTEARAAAVPDICSAVATAADDARDLEAAIARTRAAGTALVEAGDVAGGRAVLQTANTLDLFRAGAAGDEARRPGAAIEGLRALPLEETAGDPDRAAIAEARRAATDTLAELHGWIDRSADAYAIGELQQILDYAYSELDAPVQRRAVAIGAACRAGAIMEALPATEAGVSDLLAYGFQLNRASRIEPDLWNWARSRVLDWLERRGGGLDNRGEAVFVAATLAIPSVDPDSRAVSTRLLDWGLETLWTEHELNPGAPAAEYRRRANTAGGVVRLMIGFMISDAGEANLDALDTAYVERFERAVRLLRESALGAGADRETIDTQAAKLLGIARRLKRDLAARPGG